MGILRDCGTSTLSSRDNLRGERVKDYEANYNCNCWCHNQRDLIYYKIMLLHKVYDIISPFHINTSLKLQASSATNKIKPSFK